MTGARIGAIPLTEATAEKNAAAAFPVNKSAMTARPMTMPAAPAAPWISRRTISSVIDVVIAHSAETTTKTATPTSNGRRRPSRSDSGPVITCPTASPTMHADNVSCAAEDVEFSSPGSSGSAGRYMSRHSGPNADSAPSATIGASSRLTPPPPGTPRRLGDPVAAPRLCSRFARRAWLTPTRWCPAACW